MSKEVKRYNFDVDKFGSPRAYESEHGRWIKRDGYEALLAERDALKGALERIVAAEWSSSETATDFAISQTKGFLIWEMKKIAHAALQGEQP